MKHYFQALFCFHVLSAYSSSPDWYEGIEPDYNHVATLIIPHCQSNNASETFLQNLIRIQSVANNRGNSRSYSFRNMINLRWYNRLHFWNSLAPLSLIFIFCTLKTSVLKEVATKDRIESKVSTPIDELEVLQSRKESDEMFDVVSLQD